MINKKHLTSIIGLLLFFLPIVAFGQNDTESANSLLKFVKGDGAFEKWFMNAFMNLDKEVAEMGFHGSILGRAIGGIGALFSLGYMGFQMQSGDREWEIMPMLKPLFIGLILLHWTAFYNLIQQPFLKLAEPSIAMFNDIEREANDLRITRFAKQNALVKHLIKEEANQQIKEAQESYVPFAEEMAEVSIAIKEWGLSMKFSLQKTLSEVFEAIALTILRVMTYLIFFIQKMWSYILIVLGPIAIGFTLVPGFESSLTSWIAKFVNINLYTFIAFTIINIGQILIISAYTMEIDRLNEFMNSDNVIKESAMALIPQYLENSGMIYSVLFTVVAYLITGVGVLMTPTIADSIVSAGGAGIMTKMKGATNKTGSAVRGAGKMGAKAGVAGVKGGVLAGHALKNLANRLK